MTAAVATALLVAASAAAGIRVPHGFRASLYAQGLEHPTAIAFGPDRRLYVAQDTGTVAVLDPGSRRPLPFARGFPTPLGLAWKDRTLFVSVAGGVRAVRLRGRAAGRRWTVLSGLPYERHQQDNVVIGRDGRLYLGSGSTCDACEEHDPRSAAILSARLDGSDLRVVASGLRNPYGLAVQPRTGRIYASVNGRDKLGRHEPAETVVRVRWGARYGWPRCWPSFRRRRLVGSCGGVAKPLAYLEPHSSADGMAFWHRELYVAEWGQYDSTRAGRRVVRIDLPSGRASTFADGFDHPLAVLPAKRGLLVADWGRGIVYRIHR